jgi:hypothetical protein
MMSSLITLHAAAAILGMRPQTLRARIVCGRSPLKLARRHPLQRVRLLDVLQYRETIPPVAPADPYICSRCVFAARQKKDES